MSDDRKIHRVISEKGAMVDIQFCDEFLPHDDCSKAISLRPLQPVARLGEIGDPVEPSGPAMIATCSVCGVGGHASDGDIRLVAMNPTCRECYIDRFERLWIAPGKPFADSGTG